MEHVVSSIRPEPDAEAEKPAFGLGSDNTKEQKVNAKNVDHKSDIYALGVIVYEAFTGKLPMGKFKLPSEVNPKLPRALDELLPDWRERGAPLLTPATHDRFLYLTERRAVRLPTPPQMHNRGNYIISLGNLCRWLASQAEELGVEIYPGFAGAQVLYDDKYLLPGDLGSLLVLLLVVGGVWLVVRLTRRSSADPPLAG